MMANHKGSLARTLVGDNKWQYELCLPLKSSLSVDLLSATSEPDISMSAHNICSNKTFISYKEMSWKYVLQGSDLYMQTNKKSPDGPNHFGLYRKIHKRCFSICTQQDSQHFPLQRGNGGHPTDQLDSMDFSSAHRQKHAQASEAGDFMGRLNKFSTQGFTNHAQTEECWHALQCLQLLGYTARRTQSKQKGRPILQWD